MGSAIRTNAVRDDRKLLLLLLFAMRELVLQFLEPGVGEAHRLAFTELTSKSEAMEFDGLLAEARRMSLLPPTWIDLAPAQVRDLLVRPQLFHLAALSYSAPCLPIPVCLFMADENRDDTPLRGWSECLPEGWIRVIPTAGTHYSMMRRPLIKALGQALSTAIRNSSREINKGPELGASATSLQAGGSEATS